MQSPVLAATASWPVLVVAVVAVTGLCLWLLFRRGSIGDRARHDHDRHDHDRDGRTEEGPDDGPESGPSR